MAQKLARLLKRSYKMIDCNLFNETKIRISKKLVCDSVKETIRNHAEKGNYALSIVFVSEERIKVLNNIYYNKDKPTDVLSFSAEDRSQPKADQPMAGAKIHGGEVDADDSTYLGEIVVCPSHIKKKLYHGKTFRWELSHVIVHGTLHLLGMHHEDKENSIEHVHKLEDKIIKKVYGS